MYLIFINLIDFFLWHNVCNEVADALGSDMYPLPL